jgi:hypothetical protein
MGPADPVRKKKLVLPVPDQNITTATYRLHSPDCGYVPVSNGFLSRNSRVQICAGSFVCLCFVFFGGLGVCFFFFFWGGGRGNGGQVGLDLGGRGGVWGSLFIILSGPIISPPIAICT